MAHTRDLAVRARGLVKEFKGVCAVDGIDLDVPRGGVFGVLGPNGAGRTTTLRMLATLLRIDAGRAEVFGVDVERHPHHVRQLIGVTGSTPRWTGSSPPTRTCGCSPASTASPAPGEVPGRDPAGAVRTGGRPTAPSTSSPAACAADSTWRPTA